MFLFTCIYEMRIDFTEQAKRESGEKPDRSRHCEQ